MSNLYRKIRNYVPIVPFCIFVFGILTLLIYVIVRNSVSFANFFNYNISAPFRAIISMLTSWIPFSLAETAIISAPFWIVVLIYIAVKMAKKGKRAALRYLSTLLSILCFIAVSFVWTYSSGYYTSTIDKKLNLERKELSGEDLYNSAVIIIENLNELSNEIIYDNTGASVMPYSYSKMSSEIYKAYKTFTKEYKTVRNFPSKIKPIILSEPLTYTHLSGIFSFMTGEANINVNYPDFIIASSAAHEMAHQRGIAREDEANFIAFLVCINSDDAFLKYSGYLDVYGYIMSALSRADDELYEKAMDLVDYRVMYDRYSYSVFFKKYTQSKASEVSDKVNNSYLQANGQKEGTKSYGLVTDLVCAYLSSK